MAVRRSRRTLAQSPASDDASGLSASDSQSIPAKKVKLSSLKTEHEESDTTTQLPLITDEDVKELSHLHKNKEDKKLLDPSISAAVKDIPSIERKKLLSIRLDDQHKVLAMTDNHRKEFLLNMDEDEQKKVLDMPEKDRTKYFNMDDEDRSKHHKRLARRSRDAAARETKRSLDNKHNNGRVKGRKLVDWHRARMYEKLLLHLVYESHKADIELPWDATVQRLAGPGRNGSSAKQQLGKLRSVLLAEGHLVPPLMGKKWSNIDPNIRGVVRDFSGPYVGSEKILTWDEDWTDLQESLVVPNVVRGSGNYRKDPVLCAAANAKKQKTLAIKGAGGVKPVTERGKSSTKDFMKQPNTYNGITPEFLNKVKKEENAPNISRRYSTRQRRLAPKSHHDEDIGELDELKDSLESGSDFGGDADDEGDSDGYEDGDENRDEDVEGYNREDDDGAGEQDASEDESEEDEDKDELSIHSDPQVPVKSRIVILHMSPEKLAEKLLELQEQPPRFFVHWNEERGVYLDGQGRAGYADSNGDFKLYEYVDDGMEADNESSDVAPYDDDMDNSDLSDMLAHDSGVLNSAPWSPVPADSLYGQLHEQILGPFGPLISQIAEQSRFEHSLGDRSRGNLSDHSVFGNTGGPGTLAPHNTPVSSYGTIGATGNIHPETTASRQHSLPGMDPDGMIPADEIPDFELPEAIDEEMFDATDILGHHQTLFSDS